MFISVDLPAPFSPSSACTSPGRSSKSTRSSATTPGNRFVMPRISRTVAASTAHDSKDLLLKRRGDLEPARDDLLPDLVHLVDEHPWQRGIDLAHAHAAVRKGELQVVVALELACLGRLDHVEDAEVDVLDAADQNPLGVLRLILVDTDAPDVVSVR